MALPAAAAAALSRLLSRLASGDLSPLVAPLRFVLPEDAPARSWSLLNRSLAFAQTLALDCRGYRQWQEAGRQVRAGSHAAAIFVPRLVKDDHAESDKATRLAGWLYANVFPITSTEGPPLPEYTPRTLPPLADLATKLGYTVTYGPTPPDSLGLCAGGARALYLGTDDPLTYLHELAHAVDWQLRPGGLKGGQHADQEAPAEIAAAVLCELYLGANRSGDVAAYLANMPQDIAMKTLSTTTAILTHVLGLAEA
jgi:hypothetical protein